MQAAMAQPIWQKSLVSSFQASGLETCTVAPRHFKTQSAEHMKGFLKGMHMTTHLTKQPGLNLMASVFSTKA